MKNGSEGPPSRDPNKTDIDYISKPKISRRTFFKFLSVTMATLLGLYPKHVEANSPSNTPEENSPENPTLENQLNQLLGQYMEGLGIESFSDPKTELKNLGSRLRRSHEFQVCKSIMYLLNFIKERQITDIDELIQKSMAEIMAYEVGLFIDNDNPNIKTYELDGQQHILPIDKKSLFAVLAIQYQTHLYNYFKDKFSPSYSGEHQQALYLEALVNTLAYNEPTGILSGLFNDQTSMNNYRRRHNALLTPSILAQIIATLNYFSASPSDANNNANLLPTGYATVTLGSTDTFNAQRRELARRIQEAMENNEFPAGVLYAIPLDDNTYAYIQGYRNLGEEETTRRFWELISQHIRTPQNLVAVYMGITEESPAKKLLESITPPQEYPEISYVIELLSNISTKAAELRQALEAYNNGDIFYDENNRLTKEVMLYLILSELNLIPQRADLLPGDTSSPTIRGELLKRYNTWAGEYFQIYEGYPFPLTKQRLKELINFLSGQNLILRSEIQHLYIPLDILSQQKGLMRYSVFALRFPDENKIELYIPTKSNSDSMEPQIAVISIEDRYVSIGTRIPPNQLNRLNNIYFFIIPT